MKRSAKSHANQIADDFKKSYVPKYMKGQAEHGGQLWEKPGMLRNMEEEILDFYSYFHVTREQVQKAHDAFEAGDYETVKNYLDKLLGLEGPAVMDDSDSDGFSAHSIK